MTNEMKDRLLYPAMASAATVIFHIAGLTWSWAALIGFLGWPIVGTLVTSGDDYELGNEAHWPWASFLGQSCLGLSVVGFVAYFDGTWGFGWWALAVGALAAALAGLFLRRRG
jgi:hypothetical protein